MKAVSLLPPPTPRLASFSWQRAATFWAARLCGEVFSFFLLLHLKTTEPQFLFIEVTTMLGNQKKAGVAVLLSDTIDYKIKTFTRDEDQSKKKM